MRTRQGARKLWAAGGERMGSRAGVGARACAVGGGAHGRWGKRGRADVCSRWGAYGQQHV